MKVSGELKAQWNAIIMIMQWNESKINIFAAWLDREYYLFVLYPNRIQWNQVQNYESDFTKGSKQNWNKQYVVLQCLKWDY
jgi:hypothetical protein